jgi:uncharacterized SAM-binding protein YcdF (DUF218 family)
MSFLYNVQIRIAQMKWVIAIAVVLALLGLTVAVTQISAEIARQSTVDEAQSADIILVLGAAEYRGKPSPVLRARLDHALSLYKSGLAPRILTTGGAGGDPVYTEGAVGRSYLVSQGVPSEAIVVEPEGETTVYSTAAAAEIMRRMGLKSCIVVSDGYHIFRVKKMLEFRGLTVYGSPRSLSAPNDWRERWLYIRQAVGYLLWKVGVTV